MGGRNACLFHQTGREIRSLDTRSRGRRAEPRRLRSRRWREHRTRVASTTWDVVDRTPDALRKWRVDAFSESAALSFSIPAAAEPPLVEASRSLDTVHNFLSVHELGFAQTKATDEGTQVVWSDIRYCWSATECALWFGGVFDRDGRPVRQVVRVGQWERTRAVSP